MTYNICYEAFQAKHRPLTPITNQTASFFSHPYLLTLHTQYTIDLSRLKVKYEDKINAENQKVVNSLKDKWEI